MIENVFKRIKKEKPMIKMCKVLLALAIVVSSFMGNFSYVQAATEFTITLKANDGKGDDVVQTVKAGDNFDIPKNEFTYSGKNFWGWMLTEKSSTDGVTYRDQDTIYNVSDNMTLYARWTENSDFQGGNLGWSAEGLDSIVGKDDLNGSTSPTIASVVTVTFGGVPLTYNQHDAVSYASTWDKELKITVAEGYKLEKYRIVCAHGGKGHSEPTDPVYDCKTVSEAHSVPSFDSDGNVISGLSITTCKSDFSHSSKSKQYWVLLKVVPDTSRYKVTYDWGSLSTTLKDYDISSFNQTNLKYNAAVTSESIDKIAGVTDAVSSAGKVFVGWKVTSDKATYNYSLEAGKTFAVTGNMTLTAQWADAEYTVTGYEGVYDGKSHGVTVSPSTAKVGQTLKYSVDGTNWSTTAPTFTHVEETGVDGKRVYVKVSQVVDYNGEEKEVTVWRGSAIVKITPKSVILESKGATKTYDGTALTYHEVKDSIGFVTGEGVKDYSFTGSQTQVGVSANSYTFTLKDNTRSSNYDIGARTGNLEVTPIGEITVALESVEKVYDGTPLRSTAIKSPISGLAAGDRVVVTTKSYCEITDVKLDSNGNVTSIVNEIDTVKVFNSANQDVTSNYAKINTVNGTLQINPIGITLTSQGAEKVYDSTPLTKPGVTLSNDEYSKYFKKYEAVGSQTVVGNSKNTIQYELAQGMNKDNFNIELIEGKLKVTQAGKITVSALSASKDYDGTPLTAGYDVVLGQPIGTDRIEVEMEGSITNYDKDGVVNKVKSIKVFNVNDVDVTDCYDIVYGDDGLLEIKRLVIDLQSDSATEEYSGNVLKRPDVKVTGNFANGEGFEYCNAIGEITYVGKVENLISWKLADGTNPINYIIKESIGTLEITKRTDFYLEITAASSSREYDGTAYVDSGSSVAGEIEGHTVGDIVVTGSVTHVADSKANNNIVTSYKIFNSAGIDVTDQFDGVLCTAGTISITPRTITVTTGSATQVYNGTALTNSDVHVEGLVDGETVSATTTGSQTNVGDSKNGFNLAWIETAVESDYVLAKEHNLGVLEVTPAPLTVTTGSSTEVYNGTALTNGYAKVEGLVNGETVVVTTTGSQTNVGDSKNGYSITWGDTDRDNYKIVKEDLGVLEVTRAPLTVTTGSSTEVYNGTALTNGYAKVDGLVNDETVVVTATGSQTNVGDSENGYSLAWGDTDRDNYEIVKEDLGVLEVTRAPLTVTTGSSTEVYNGTALTNAYAKVDGLVDSEIVVATATGSQTNVGDSENGYSLAWGDTDRDNYEIVEEDLGRLTVTPALITITTLSAEKPFDGSALTEGGYTITGDLVSGEEITARVTGSQTAVGSSDNTFDVLYGEGVDSKNYAITPVLGTLTVTDAPELSVVKTSNVELVNIADGVVENIVYTITVTNNGLGNMGQFNVVDLLPSYLTFVSATGDYEIIDGSIVWEVSGLLSGQSITYTITTALNDFEVEDVVNVALIVVDGEELGRDSDELEVTITLGMEDDDDEDEDQPVKTPVVETSDSMNLSFFIFTAIISLFGIVFGYKRREE